MAIKKFPDGRIDKRVKEVCQICGVLIEYLNRPIGYVTYNKGLCLSCALEIDDSMRCVSCHYPITEYEIEELNQHCSSCVAERAEALVELREDK